MCCLLLPACLVSEARTSGDYILLCACASDLARIAVWEPHRSVQGKPTMNQDTDQIYGFAQDYVFRRECRCERVCVCVCVGIAAPDNLMVGLCVHQHTHTDTLQCVFRMADHPIRIVLNFRTDSLSKTARNTHDTRNTSTNNTQWAHCPPPRARFVQHNQSDNGAPQCACSWERENNDKTPNRSNWPRVWAGRGHNYDKLNNINLIS